MKVISNSTADMESIIKHDSYILTIYFQISTGNIYIMGGKKLFRKVSLNKEPGELICVGKHDLAILENRLEMNHL